MTTVEALAKKVVEGGEITREEALELYEAPLEDVCHWANRIREKFCENGLIFARLLTPKAGVVRKIVASALSPFIVTRQARFIRY